MNILTTITTERRDGRRRVPDRRFVVRLCDVPRNGTAPVAVIPQMEHLIARGFAAEVPLDFVPTPGYRLPASPDSAFKSR